MSDNRTVGALSMWLGLLGVALLALAVLLYVLPLVFGIDPSDNTIPAYISAVLGISCVLYSVYITQVRNR